jgi:hypothetical protein
MGLRKKLVLLSVSIIVVLFLASPQFTGWLVDTLDINISILPEVRGCLSLVENLTWVYQNSPLTIPAKLENCGSTLLNGTMFLTINSSDDVVVNETNSTLYSISTIESFFFNFTWTASQPPGLYYVNIRDNYTNETSEINASFYILQPPPEPGQPRPGISHPPVQRFIDFSVDVPQDVTVYRGSNQTLLMKVRNTGNYTIGNLSIMIAQRNFSIRSVPEFASLQVNASVFFFVEIDASKAGAGYYQLLWVAVGDSVNKSGYITVNVVSVEAGTECRQSVSYYIGVMDKLKEQIFLLASEGKNVTLARQYFDETMFDLMTAQTYYQIGSNKDCIDRMGLVMKGIERIVVELARAKTEPLLLILPLIYEALLWSLVTIIAVILIAAAARRVMAYRHQRTRSSRLILPKKWS